MNEIIERLKRFSLKEFLSYVIFNEEDEVKYYVEFVEKVKRKSVRVLFKKMSRESKGYEFFFRRMFEWFFLGEEFVKVDVFLVEVYLFYFEFEKVEDYIRVLEYCMESEFFVKRIYEILVGVVENEDVWGIVFEFLQIEQKYYEEIKKVYDIVIFFECRYVFIERLGLGVYLVIDDEKVKYIFLDMLMENREVIVVIREYLDKFREFIEIDNVIWVLKILEEYFGKVVFLKFVFEFKGEFFKFFKFVKENGKQGVVFVQNVGYLVVEFGFKDVMDFLFYVKDVVMVYNGYIIVSVNLDVFEKKEWGLFMFEFEVILQFFCFLDDFFIFFNDVQDFVVGYLGFF